MLKGFSSATYVAALRATPYLVSLCTLHQANRRRLRWCLLHPTALYNAGLDQSLVSLPVVEVRASVLCRSTTALVGCSFQDAVSTIRKKGHPCCRPTLGELRTFARPGPDDRLFNPGPGYVLSNAVASL